MQKEEIIKITEEIKPYLLTGDRSDIAKKLGVDAARITKILKGEVISRKGLEILKALQERAEENKKIFQS